jgi:hypothetical protein
MRRTVEGGSSLKDEYWTVPIVEEVQTSQPTTKAKPARRIRKLAVKNKNSRSKVK